MSRSWTVSTHGVPKKRRKPAADDCQRKFSTLDLLRLVDEEDAFNQRISIRTATVEEKR